VIEQHPSSEPLPETEAISKNNTSGGDWQTTQYSNSIRYRPSRKYYARVRIKDKLIVKSLKTTKISVAKLRLSDLEKSERQKAENRSADGLTNDCNVMDVRSGMPGRNQPTQPTRCGKSGRRVLWRAGAVD